jgi:cellulose synthase/poly-beta-1,6-N-acetylglucosamine synthase-like glycosyltransferase
MISLIISFYKRLDFLELIFQSLDKQSFKNFEVIIAEDNNDPKTIEFINKARLMHTYNIQHVSQEDIGFRKTRILNNAAKTAKGEQIVFIDGDCILQKHFMKEYNKAITDTHFCYGRRVFCSKKHTDILLKSKSIKNNNILMAFLYGGKSIGAGLYLPFKKNKDKQHRRILGCNWGILKKNILAVNGFDEDYNRAGVGEDFDIDWRLKKQGLKVRSMKGKAIVYHMYHKVNYNPSDTEYVEKIMEEKKILGKSFCVNGISKKEHL